MNQFYMFSMLAIVFLIKSVASLQDITLNNISYKTAASLLKIIGKYENIKYIIIQPSKRKQKDNENNIEKNYNSILYGVKDNRVEERKFERPGKKIFIKRLLPHGLPSSNLEFDRKYNTVYKPLVRVHKRKRLPKIGTILNIDGTLDGTDKYGIDIYDYYDNDENVLNFAVNKDLNEKIKHFKVKKAGNDFNVDEELVQPFATNFVEDLSPDEISTRLTLVEEIQKILQSIRSRPKDKIYHDTNRELDEIANLRTNQKSGEANDPLAPGRIMHLEIDETNEGPAKPKKWIPHYAPWNFWTYKKTIYQDVCPRGQVKIANLCIWIPPH